MSDWPPEHATDPDDIEPPVSSRATGPTTSGRFTLIPYGDRDDTRFYRVFDELAVGWASGSMKTDQFDWNPAMPPIADVYQLRYWLTRAEHIAPEQPYVAVDRQALLSVLRWVADDPAFTSADRDNLLAEQLETLLAGLAQHRSPDFSPVDELHPDDQEPPEPIEDI